MHFITVPATGTLRRQPPAHHTGVSTPGGVGGSVPSLRVGAESRVGDLHWGAAGKVAQVTGQPYACAEVCLRERSRKRNRTTAGPFHTSLTVAVGPF